MESNLIRRIQTDESSVYEFRLCRRRDVAFGPVRIDQWWMPITPLYAQRGTSDTQMDNHREILRMYWGAVRAEGATRHRETQERFLLASLVPHIRAEGSRTVFADAFLRPPSPQENAEFLSDLKKAIRGPWRGRLIDEFASKSWDCLGRAKFHENMQAVYDQICGDLFPNACRELEEDAPDQAVATVVAAWERLMRVIGRRAGNDDRKTVLDVISYECRAAFHDCYSLCWTSLIAALQQGDGLDATSASFHRFWHTVDRGLQQRIFHGGVFGLHPASGPLLRTDVGRALVGNWLTSPTDDNFETLLQGLFYALWWYRNRRDSQIERRSSARERTDGEMARIADDRHRDPDLNR